MRILFLLVLLLFVSVRPAWAQGTHPPSPLQALPASLTPATSTAGAALDLNHQRNRALGGFVGLIVGGLVGALVTNHYICNVPGEGNAEGICRLAGIGLGMVLGMTTGAIFGLPDGSPPRN